MTGKILIDTNLWIYLYAKNPEAKYLKVRQIVDENLDSIVVSTQVLGELYHVLTRKKFCIREEAKRIILETIAVFPILEIDALNVAGALDVNEKYGFSYWDSLLIATALLNDCQILYSEDMQHNQLIEDKVIIINPFFLNEII